MSLDQLVVDGGHDRLRDRSARCTGPQGLSLADADVATLKMHRDMMGTGDLGPSYSLLVTVNGTLDVRVPDSGRRQGLPEVRQPAAGRRALPVALAALVVGVYMACRATAPIAELTWQGSLAARRRDRRTTTISNNEIGQLATVFNTDVGEIRIPPNRQGLHRRHRVNSTDAMIE